MRERLIIKNFGPLQDIDLQLTNLNVFIGPEGIGKSCLAKLIGILSKRHPFDFPSNSEILESQLDEANINYLSSNTSIQLWQNDKKIFSFHNGQINVLDEVLSQLKNGGNAYVDILVNALLELAIQQKASDMDRKTIESFAKKALEKHGLLSEFLRSNYVNTVYIPCERILLSAFSESIMSFVNKEIPLHDYLVEFGELFEKARKKNPSLRIDFLGIEYRYENGFNNVYFQEKKFVKLSQSSSGFQSIVPMYLVITDQTAKETEGSTTFVVEEPELNIFPETQKQLTEFLVERCINFNKGKLIITTHSPYILTALNNLIQAKNSFKSNPEAKKEIEKIISSSRWLDFEEVSVYSMNDGKIQKIMNAETQLIDANPIDSVSDIVSEEFEELLNLEYEKGIA